MNLPNVIVVLVVVALAVAAFVAMRKGKGGCAAGPGRQHGGSRCDGCPADCPLKGRG